VLVHSDFLLVLRLSSFRAVPASLNALRIACTFCLCSSLFARIASILIATSNEFLACELA